MKRKNFGLSSYEIFVEAFDCDAFETQGVLYVWQHFLVFSTGTSFVSIAFLMPMSSPNL